MRILFLTQYFPPETGAPQNRLYELAIRLRRSGHEVSILTAMPNYPAMEVLPAYKGKLYAKETMDGMAVFRTWIYVSKKKKIIPRLINYFSFVFTSLFAGLFKVPKHDFVFCESPPLFLGISAFLISLFSRSKMIFNVSDLWPESAEQLGLITNKSILKITTLLEEFLYRKSYKISGQTQGIVSNISSRFPEKEVFWLPNGVDINLYGKIKETPNWRNALGFKEEDFILLYAGIIGHAQGLDVILKAADRLRLHSRIKFVLLGEGPEKERLMGLKQELGLKNVVFLNGVTKSEMPVILHSIDASIVPLKKLPLFLGAIPSKIFEVLAMRKPVLLGVDGEARNLFVNQGNCALYFTPESSNELAERIEELTSNPALCKQLGDNGYSYVAENFNRDKIAEKFEKFLLNERKS